MLKDYKEQIQDADLVLVGIGRELRADRVIDFKKAITNEHYQNLIDKEDEDSKWMRTVYEREYLLSMKETDLFKELEEVLEGKEYFVVTSNDDGLLYHTHLKKDHVTAPCGNGDFFQCSAPCDEQLYPANLGLRDLIDYYEKTGKIEFYNEKATFVRVHHSLYQIGKEIKEKGIGIKMDSRDFLNIAHE